MKNRQELSPEIAESLHQKNKLFKPVVKEKFRFRRKLLFLEAKLTEVYRTTCVCCRLKVKEVRNIPIFFFSKARPFLSKVSFLEGNL